MRDINLNKKITQLFSKIKTRPLLVASTAIVSGAFVGVSLGPLAWSATVSLCMLGIRSACLYKPTLK